MKIILVSITLMLMLLPSAAMAEDPIMGRPHWSLEVKGGMFTPALEDWSLFYDKKTMPEFAATLAYKIWRQVEVGVGAGRMQGTGQTYAMVHQMYAGSVTYTLYPVNAFVLLRGVMRENQWLVPYIGGGYTRMYYVEKVEDQDTARGHADGYHVRGGLQFSLDIFDWNSSGRMYLDYGVYHTYVFVEAEYTRAIVQSASADLGGTAYLVGLLLEF